VIPAPCGVTAVSPGCLGLLNGIQEPRQQRTADLRDGLRQLADPRVAGRAGYADGLRPAGSGCRPGQNDHGLSRKHIHESINGSLRRLGTDYVDLYQAHRFDDQTPIEETMEAFADVVRQGKALYIGVSEWTAEQLQEGHRLARELRIPFVSNQPQYNMLWRVIEDEVIPISEKLGIGQIVWSPIAQGVLTGKYQSGHAPPAGSGAKDELGGSDMISHWLKDPVLAAVQQLRPLADAAGLSMAQMAIAWVLQNSNVSAAIIGASRPEQVVENAEAAGVKLDPALLAAVDDILRPVIQRDPAMTTSPRRSTFSSR
jgi:aryl-alcohol dehydrogenase-like predicted oxidoreductase